MKNVPIKEQWVRYAKTPDRWLRQSWSSSGESLFKLGGLPTWVQAEQTPEMLYSNRKMRLLAQFDSYLPLEGGGENLWGSGGVLYVFWDEDTRTSCHFAQWT